MSMPIPSAAAFAAAGIATATALDVAIDRSGHDLHSPAFRFGVAPTYALAGITGLATAAGLGATLLPATRGFAPSLLRAGRNAAIGWAATFAVRQAIGLLFHPAGRGLHWHPSDMAQNGIDRAHMMGRELKPYERAALDVLSRMQGHGSLDSRAHEDFMPIVPTD